MWFVNDVDVSWGIVCVYCGMEIWKGRVRVGVRRMAVEVDRFERDDGVECELGGVEV